MDYFYDFDPNLSKTSSESNSPNLGRRLFPPDFLAPTSASASARWKAATGAAVEGPVPRPPSAAPSGCSGPGCWPSPFRTHSDSECHRWF